MTDTTKPPLPPDPVPGDELTDEDKRLIKEMENSQ